VPWQLAEEVSEDVRAQLARLVTPRMSPYVPHVPHPKQAAFLCCHQREVLYGGAAGGGKSDALLMAALQYACVPGYNALLLRKSFPQLIGKEGLIDRAFDWLKPWSEVHWSADKKRFTFPSGATLNFGFVDRDDDRYNYQGLNYLFVGFDELTHWRTSTAYTYIGYSRSRRVTFQCKGCDVPLVRVGPIEDGRFLHGKAPKGKRPCDRAEWTGGLRACEDCGLTAADVPLRLRAGTNPGGRGHQWVKQRFIISAKNRVFIPARIEDNPSLNRDEYEEGLGELGTVERVQLMSGDWDVTEEGKLFQRQWFTGVGLAA
jgi:hypothetical protein